MRMSEKKPYEPVIRWIEPGTGDRHRSSLMPSPHRDPTANAAIGNIMREERRKRRREEREKARKEAYEKQKEKGRQSPDAGNCH